MKKVFTVMFAMFIAAITIAQLWITTEDFTSPKNSQTVTKLDDGRVIQIGGDRGFNQYSRAVEIYEPGTNIWTSVDSLPYSLRMHSSFLLENNKVLVIGGTSDGSSSDGVLEYNADDNIWTTKTAMPEALESLSAEKLSDGRIFVCGGWLFESALVNQDAYIYDPIADSWTTVAAMPVGLVNSVCEMISEDEILIAGGVTIGFTTSANSYIYEVSSDTWTEKSNLPYPISGGMASVLMENGDVLTAGGFDFSNFTYKDKLLIFDSELGEWNEMGSLSSGLSNMSLVYLPDGTAIMAGGNDGSKYTTIENYSIAYFNGAVSSSTKGPSAAAYIVDTEDNSINPIEDLPRPTTGAMSVLLDTEDVLLSGGSGTSMAADTYNDGLVYNNPNSSVGISQLEYDLFSINPNPANTTVEIHLKDLEASQISIYSLMGKHILTQKVSTKTVCIDVQHIPAGVYLVKIKGISAATEKLIIR